jgi:Rieske Fe-S protein
MPCRPHPPDWRSTDDGDVSFFDGSFVLRVESVEDDSAAIPHPDGGFVIGFSRMCTHMGCLLVRDEEDHHIVYDERQATCGPCLCHGTTFDLLKQGLVVLGPATQYFPQLRLETVDVGGEPHVQAAGWFEGDPRHEEWPATL